MKRIRKISIKSLSVFLSVAITLLSLPLSVFALDMATENTANDISTPGTSSGDVFELVDRREESVKHFRLSDGTFVAAQYDIPVHTLDESGVWQDIDNTLVVNGNEITTNNAKIKFAKKITGNESLFTLHDGNRKITLSLDGATKKVNGVITNNESQLNEDATELQKMAELSKISASVRYEDILPKTDLEYVIQGTNIKENIVVKDQQEAYSYSFTMKLNSLTASMNENGEIIISDISSGDVVYIIPAPIMWDADWNYSDAVDMELIEQGSGAWSIVVTADAGWINSSDRVFPITIDPPIYSSSSSNITDLNLSKSGNNSYYINYNKLYVSSDLVVFWRARALPSIPSSAYITDATFHMECVTNSQLSGSIAVYNVILNWGDNIKWSNVISTTDPQGTLAENYTDSVDIYTYDIDGMGNYILDNPSGYNWNITPIVKSWYDGQNYGLALMQKPGTTFVGRADFCSNDYSVVSERPQFFISYVDMKGLESYWNYSSQSAGFAGVGNVNVATGNLVVTIPTLTSTDALMPFTPTLVYNSSLNARDYTSNHAETAYSTSFMPKGFKLNIQETLLKKSYIDKNGVEKYWFVWADADGTEHYFLPTETNNTYKDEDGLLLTLVESANSCTITDSGHNVRTFGAYTPCPTNAASAWFLQSITDQSGNKLQFGFDSLNRPISVNLIPNNKSTIQQLQLLYLESGKLFAVWNPTSKDAVVLRYAPVGYYNISTSNEQYLKCIVRVHGANSATELQQFYLTNSVISSGNIVVDATAQYFYMANDLGLIQNDLSQYSIQYRYASKKIISIQESADSSVGQSMQLTYNATSTEIRTSGTDDIINTDDDLITTLCFDSQGRTVSSYTTDLNKNQIYGASHGQYIGSDNTNAKNNLKYSVQTKQQSSNYLYNGGFEITSSNGIPYWNKIGIASTGATIPYAGNCCAQLTVNSTTTTSSIFQDVSLAKGDYSISMQIYTHESQGVKVYLKAESQSNPSNSVIQEISTNEYLATVSYAFSGLNFSAAPINNDDVEIFKISVVVTGAPTTAEVVYVDNLMLSKTTGPSEYDMLSHGHFESTQGVVDDFWDTMGATSIPTVDSGVDAFGEVLQLRQNSVSSVEQKVILADESQKAYYDEFYFVPDAQTFTISGWAKGTAQNFNQGSTFSIMLYVVYYSGGGSKSYETYTYDFDKSITDWQFLSGGFVSNPNKGLLESITVTVLYEYNPGIGYFDNISLVMDASNANFYEYSGSGYLTSHKTGKNQSWYAYDENNDMVRYVSSNDLVIGYAYDSNHRMTYEYHYKYTGLGACTPTSTTVSNLSAMYYIRYRYDTYGFMYLAWTYDNQTTSNQATRSIIRNTQIGSHIFGVVEQDIDSLNNITRYFYDETNGRLLSVIYPEGNGACYEYDAIGNVIQTIPATLYVEEIIHEEYGEYGDVYTWTEYIYDYVPILNHEIVSYDYDAQNRLSGISTDTTDYSFSYDSFGNADQIAVGTRTLVSYEYNNHNGKLHTMTYGNGDKVKYLYDNLDRITDIQYNIGEGGAFETVYSYTYDSAGNIYSTTDHVGNQTTLYRYDALGKLINFYTYDTDTYTNLIGSKVSYDEQSRVSMVHHYFDYPCPAGTYHGTTYSDMSYYSYWYDDSTGHLWRVNISGTSISGTINPAYDMLGRTTSKTIDFNVRTTNAFYNEINYQYVSGGASAESVLVSQMESVIKTNSDAATITEQTYNYTYDKNGNITMVTDGSGVLYAYLYDDLDQLIREDNRELNHTYVYSYDDAGNILLKKQYAFSTGLLGAVQNVYSYSYSDSDWGDLLTMYDFDTIEYDDIGNPVKIGYCDVDYDDHWWNWAELTWSGRQLISYQLAEQYPGDDVYYSGLVTFTYNADGIRTSKTVNGITFQYHLSGSQIIAETWSAGGVDYLLYYIYDETGAPIGLKYRTNEYLDNIYDCFFFEKNLQGDIIAIYNAAGTKIGSYKYDAWGKVFASYTGSASALEQQIVLSHNPFRYRGYYYDTQTGWYYLQSRYYNPTWGRFINADAYISTGQGLLGYNMFAYCNNNPVNLTDPTGEIAGWAIAAIVIGVVILAGSLSSCAIEKKAKIETETGYATYDEALQQAVDNVYEKSQASITTTAEYGVEYNVDIYYKESDGMFYLTQPYSDGLEREVTHREPINNDDEAFEIIGYVHYHPSVDDISLQFNYADRNVADELDAAAHIVDANKNTSSLYDYLPKRKMELID